MKNISIVAVFITLAIIASIIWFKSQNTDQQLNNPAPWPELGEVVYVHNQVPIYSNGTEVYKSHGKHYSADGYYYGRKWQCVEFVKRYYYDAHNHSMPNVWGHAKDFYDIKTTHGTVNSDRGMLQFKNGSNEKPEVNDLLVWNNGPYGHVAIVSAVNKNSITLVQQNMRNAAEAKIELNIQSGIYSINGTNPPVGWLRLP